jgi:hypothetical protein
MPLDKNALTTFLTEYYNRSLMSDIWLLSSVRVSLGNSYNLHKSLGAEYNKMSITSF